MCDLFNGCRSVGIHVECTLGDKRESFARSCHWVNYDSQEVIVIFDYYARDFTLGR